MGDQPNRQAKTDPPPDPVVSALRDLVVASIRNTEAIGALARQVASVDESVQQTCDTIRKHIKDFSQYLGGRDAEEGAVAKELRNIHGTLNTLVSDSRIDKNRIEALEDKLSKMQSKPETNGVGHA